MTTIVVEDPELAAIFERIARAIPGAKASGSNAGLDPHTFLRAYAALLEQGELVGLMTVHPPVRDPEA